MSQVLRLLVIGVVSTLLLIPIAGYSSNVIHSEALLVAVSVALGYVVVPAILLRLWPPRTATVKSMQNALWEGELQTVDYRVLEIAQVSEQEDEGLHFLIAIGEGRTLYLSGQYLYGLVERRAFPSEAVRVFLNKITGDRYGIEPVGKPIESWSLYRPFDFRDVNAPDPLEDGRVYDETIERMVARFGLQMAQPPRAA